MMEIKRKTFVSLSGTLLATQRFLATVSALMAVWQPPGHLIPFLAIGRPSHEASLWLFFYFYFYFTKYHNVWPSP